jgi:hypothetical protein
MSLRLEVGVKCGLALEGAFANLTIEFPRLEVARSDFRCTLVDSISVLLSPGIPNHPFLTGPRRHAIQEKKLNRYNQVFYYPVVYDSTNIYVYI